jgi:hypothetical protein
VGIASGLPDPSSMSADKPQLQEGRNCGRDQPWPPWGTCCGAEIRIGGGGRGHDCTSGGRVTNLFLRPDSPKPTGFVYCISRHLFPDLVGKKIGAVQRQRLFFKVEGTYGGPNLHSKR